MDKLIIHKFPAPTSQPNGFCNRFVTGICYDLVSECAAVAAMLISIYSSNRIPTRRI